MALIVTKDKKCFNPILLDYMKKQKTGKDAVSFIKNEKNLRNLVDSTGSTLLHHAALLNCTLVAQYLVDQGCDVDARDNLGNTPLMLAVKKCSQRTIGVLLSGNADMYVLDEAGKPLVCSALRSRVVRVIKIFLNHIQTICSKDCNKMALKLKELECTLHVAMLLKRADLIKSMLDFGYSVDSYDRYGEPILHAAVEQGDLEMVKLLVEYGADINAPDSCNRTPLFNYLGSRNELPREIVQFFIDKGVDLKATNSFDEMLIFYLIGVADVKSVKILLPYVDFSERDPKGKTALHCLAYNFNDGVIEFARNQQFDVDALDCDGQTPLMVAVKQNLLENVKFLLEHGADVTLADNNGETALTLAFTSEFQVTCNSDDMTRVVELLLLSGANAQQLFNGRKTIFDAKPQEDLNELYKPALANLVLKEASDVPIIEEIRSKISSNDDLKNLFDLYKRQYEKLKKITVDDTVNLHDILVANEEKITFYRNNPRFVSTFKRVINNNKSNVNSYYVKTLLRRMNN